MDDGVHEGPSLLPQPSCLVESRLHRGGGRGLGRPVLSNLSNPISTKRRQGSPSPAGSEGRSSREATLGGCRYSCERFRSPTARTLTSHQKGATMTDAATPETATASQDPTLA